MGHTVGRVARLFRYPVKSMGGESLEEVRVAPTGVLGDRAHALIDDETGKAVSGKRPRYWDGIMDFAASYVTEPAPGRELPGLRVTTPDGISVDSREEGAIGAIGRHASEYFGRSVRFADSAPAGVEFEYHWPDMDGLVYKGRTYRDELTSHEMPAGTFFDGCAVVILTTSGIGRMSELAPDSDFDVRRFRPNILVETEEPGFVENDWVDGTLDVGEARFDIIGPCLRCVMVTSAQGGLPKDPGVLRAAFDHNDGNLGVKSSVAATGRIRVGDPVVYSPSG